MANKKFFPKGIVKEGKEIPKGGTEYVIPEPAAPALPYKVYTAQLNSNGTNPPDVVVLQNTLGFTPTWSRNALGTYIVSEAGTGFTWGKTIAFLGGISEGIIPGITMGSGVIYVKTVNASTNAYVDTGFSNSFIEIRIYP